MRIPEILKRAAHLEGAEPAVTFDDVTHSWSEVEDRVARTADLLTGLGVAPGDRVAMLALNSLDQYALFYAAPWIGAILVPLNWRLSEPEQMAVLEDCAPRVLVADAANADTALRLAGKCAFIETVVFADAGSPPDGMVSLHAALTGAERAAEEATHDDDVAYLFYTSGTTGRPKGVMLTHKNFYVNSLGGLLSYNLRVKAPALMPGPLFHVATAMRVFTAAMSCAHTVIMRKFDLEELFRSIEAHRIQNLSLVPTMIDMMLRHPRLSEFDLTSMRRIGYGAAPSTPELQERALTAWPDVEFRHGYGMTEAAPLIAILDAEDHALTEQGRRRMRSVGRPLAYIDVRILDMDGNEQPRGASGEIVVRGPNVMKGYWNKPEETAAVLRDGWYHTGDAGYMDEDGYLFVIDRVKDMIITGGENVYSTEVESALQEHAGVAQCAVIGIPHPSWGEAVHAVVVLVDGTMLSEADLIIHCRDRIAHYKCPSSVEVRSEPLPLSGANKIMKNKLRDQYLAARVEG
jgi:acyl-CoA synthetase (AMP-forming)/AMP-acid ligase II